MRASRYRRARYLAHLYQRKQWRTYYPSLVSIKLLLILTFLPSFTPFFPLLRVLSSPHFILSCVKPYFSRLPYFSHFSSCDSCLPSYYQSIFLSPGRWGVALKKLFHDICRSADASKGFTPLRSGILRLFKYLMLPHSSEYYS